MITIDWDQIHRQMKELDARYTAINRSWEDSGIPTFVLQTPDWQTGWRVLLDWLAKYDFRGGDPNVWEDVVARSRPRAETSWAHEVHIFSHMHCPHPGGHSPAHAAIEEEGAHAILTWWSGRKP
jgi:hypothetical protein